MTSQQLTREYHVAMDYLDPENPEKLFTTYLGIARQEHVEQVRAFAERGISGQVLREHPRQHGSFMVLRADGRLDVYTPADAADFDVRDPDPYSRRQGDATEIFQDSSAPAAAAGPDYISGAVRLGSQSIGGAMDHPESGPRIVWHTTESPPGQGYFQSMSAFLIRVGAEPQIIYDPQSDLLGQFGPLRLSSRALRNDGSRRTNREGRVNIQVEVLGRAENPWTNGFDPATRPNFRKIIAAGHLWGVPDEWPAGAPPGSAGPGGRPRPVWQSRGGHYAHRQVPGNDHWDPGAIDTTKVPGRG